MLRRYELSHAEMRELVRAIDEMDMLPLATPFSPEDVELIESLALPAIKIASPDLVNRVLLERCVKSYKPLLISTGASTMEEVAKTVGWLDSACAEFALLHCVSCYPTPAITSPTLWRWCSPGSPFRCSPSPPTTSRRTVITAAACWRPSSMRLR